MDNGFPLGECHRQKIKVLFAFTVPKPKLTHYRAVQSTDGFYRMEKRGELAKKFKPFMWCGSEQSLYQHKEAIEFCLRTGPLPFSISPLNLTDAV